MSAFTVSVHTEYTSNMAACYINDVNDATPPPCTSDLAM